MPAIKIYAFNDGLNTVNSLKRSFSEGANASICDLRRTLDGQFIAFRDRTLSKLCGRDWVVSGTAWSHIKNLNLSHGEHIAHLDDILNYMILRPKVEMFFKLALKSSQDVADLAHEISKSGITNRIFLTVPSSQGHFLTAARKKVKGISAALISTMTYNVINCAKEYDCKRVCLGMSNNVFAKSLYEISSVFFSVKKQISEAQKNDVEISAGIADSPRALRNMKDLGVNAVWTNNISAAMKYL